MHNLPSEYRPPNPSHTWGSIAPLAARGAHSGNSATSDKSTSQTRPRHYPLHSLSKTSNAALNEQYSRPLGMQYGAPTLSPPPYEPIASIPANTTRDPNDASLNDQQLRSYQHRQPSHVENGSTDAASSRLAHVSNQQAGISMSLLSPSTAYPDGHSNHKLPTDRPHFEGGRDVRAVSSAEHGRHTTPSEAPTSDDGPCITRKDVKRCCGQCGFACCCAAVLSLISGMGGG